VQLVQPGRDNIHHHALNDAPPAQLSAVAVLIVNDIRRGAAAKCSNGIDQY
jgi:hypothetical protein